MATGTPEQIPKVKESYTGQFLKKYLAHNGNGASNVPSDHVAAKARKLN